MFTAQAWEETRPFHLDLEFRSKADARELADELSKWVPHGGWSEDAKYLFHLLRGNLTEIK